MKIFVQVVYALPGAQEVVEIELEQGAPVEDAINASGIPARHPEIDLKTQRLGLWGRPVSLATEYARRRPDRDLPRTEC